MDIFKILADELSIRLNQVEAAVKLIDEGNTIPFIARYRKEVTGNLNDEVLRNLHERLSYLRKLDERKAAIIESITEQEKMTPELRKKIDAATTMVEVEDLYLPYRPKRRTRAMIAKEKGLQGLADLFLAQEDAEPLKAAEAYVSEEKGVADIKAALAGASDILAENFAENAGYRSRIRELTAKEGFICSAAKDDKTESVYEMYYTYEEQIKKAAGHRILALNRGEKEKFLTVKIDAPKDRIIEYMSRKIIRTKEPSYEEFLLAAIEDSYSRLIAPSIEREIRNELTEKAEEGAINVFGKNLTQLLMQPPISGKTVLGWDPAFRTGCKLAVVDPTGKVLDTSVIYPTAPTNEKKIKEAKALLTAWTKKYGISLISLGNGTASRESEQIIVEWIKESRLPVSYVIVNEAGASVYSASKMATEEFPKFDVGQRSAASIARRLEDPLAELVKIEPASIGVGQYQHDMNQKKLSETLQGVVETVVNRVGVDLNTASYALLGYVSGITAATAKNIVAYREANGRFTDRRQLLKVPKLGPKAYEQCAGFLRIRDGKNPLDATGVHPESYEATMKLLKELGFTADDVAKKNLGSLSLLLKGKKNMASAIGVGELTFADIVKELEKPGLDPRDSVPGPILKSDVLEMKDLKPGMILKGTVRNVIDFGAFVDIGVHQDGLVHISRMTDRYIKHPLEVVSVGDIVNVQIESVDLTKKRIALTMKIKNEVV